MGFINDIFGLGPKVDYAELIVNGAKIIDVRSPGEFASCHPNGAVNIPLNSIQHKVDKIKKYNTPVICVCASGMRSGQAARMLMSQGLEAYNAGSWTNLR